ncbi:hypothetical protein C0995_016524 [Termitomyces sp. Mi166|nr:hypothetical protein C0995_016524 [Termitomyces sp. Mi166\
MLTMMKQSLQLFAEHARIEDMIDDDIPMFKFIRWQLFTQATLQFHIPRPTRTRKLLIHNAGYRGRFYIAKDAWSLPTFAHHVPGCRFVYEIWSKKLKDFSSAEEFYTIILDVLEALKEGTERCDWLHGDIRWDHMLIDPRGRGVLTDFDQIIYERTKK